MYACRGFTRLQSCGLCSGRVHGSVQVWVRHRVVLGKYIELSSVVVQTNAIWLCATHVPTDRKRLFSFSFLVPADFLIAIVIAWVLS